MLLFDGGEPVVPVFALLMANTRFGDLMVPDIHSVRAALELGARLIGETIDRYGRGAYLGALRYATDASAASMRSALERIPDGVYEGSETMDGDTLSDLQYVAHVRITKRGGRAEFDFSGSSVASSTSINCAWPDSKTAVMVALKCLVDRRSRYTAGSLRDVDILLPAGAFNNAAPPRACQSYQEVVIPMLYAIYNALNPVLGPGAVGAEAPLFTFAPVGTTSSGRAWSSFTAGGGVEEGRAAEEVGA
jgi:N-methylhydantoinase B